jgi:hypothetical protein
MSSSSTGMIPGCEGDLTEGLSGATNTGLISDMCGVFVQADATGTAENGTQASPYHTLEAALKNAGNKRVYACNSAKMAYAEAVTVSAPVEIYGGFECGAGWVWKAATRSLITGVPTKVSLTLTKSSDGARIEGFKITSASGQSPGTSSVAVATDDITATFVSCDIEAGDGADGRAGTPPAGTATAGVDAPVTDPLTISACINPAALTFGAPGMTMCDDLMTSAGGAGGKGGVTGTNSGNGAPGSDGTPASMADGKGGAGQDTMTLCVAGAAGKEGDPGANGAGGTALGTLSLAGFINPAGADGTDGKPGLKGQGGGGGGGVKSSSFCPGNVDGNGASGGGGGGGGCGGLGGAAGTAGGSSIALLSMGTKLVLTNVTLKSGKGGKGGNGAGGQNGGALGGGGKGGLASNVAGSKPGCKGGDGGAGGAGGPGGGGRGGHSIGLAVKGAPKGLMVSFTPGAAGPGGTAGSGGSPAGDGTKGLGGSSTAACWDFSANATCAK